MVCYPNLKSMEIMINNVVSMFLRQWKDTLRAAATDWDWENRTVQSVAARSIVHKFLQRICMDQAWKSINGFLMSFTSISDQFKILHSNRKSHSWKLSIIRVAEGMYTYFSVLNLNHDRLRRSLVKRSTAFQFRGSEFESLFFFLFLSVFFYPLYSLLVVHTASNII